MSKKRDRTGELLAELDAMSPDAGSGPDAPRITQALGDRSSFVVARAAELAAEPHTPALIAAFDRLMAGEDSQCKAKTAVVRALDRVEARAHEVYLRAIRHRQYEPVYGGKEDVSIELRGLAAIALVNARTPGASLELARLLTDEEPRARAAAAHAMGASGRAELVPLLWFKALSGDDEPEVATEVMAALLAIEGDDMVEPVASLLVEGGDRDRAIAAAMALGQARRSGALAPLIAWTRGPRISPDERRAGLLAIAMLRSPAGVAHLLELLEREPVVVARPALEALLLHRHDPTHLAAVTKVVRARKTASLTAALEAAVER